MARVAAAVKRQRVVSRHRSRRERRRSTAVGCQSSVSSQVKQSPTGSRGADQLAAVERWSGPPVAGRPNRRFGASLASAAQASPGPAGVAQVHPLRLVPPPPPQARGSSGQADPSTQERIPSARQGAGGRPKCPSENGPRSRKNADDVRPKHQPVVGLQPGDHYGQVL